VGRGQQRVRGLPSIRKGPKTPRRQALTRV